MFDIPWGAVATVVGAAIGAIGFVVAQRQKRLIEDCRLAVRDLKRFRELEALWSEELSKLLKSSPEAERKRMRAMFPAGNRIGDYGEPQRIEKLLTRLK